MNRIQSFSVLNFLEEDEGRTIAELLSETLLSVDQLHKDLIQLEEWGFVNSQLDGSTIRYYLIPIKSPNKPSFKGGSHGHPRLLKDGDR